MYISVSEFENTVIVQKMFLENGKFKVPVKQSDAHMLPAKMSYNSETFENNCHHDFVEETIETSGQCKYCLSPRLSQVAPSIYSFYILDRSNKW